jgi:ATP-dependent helicase HrpB
MIGSARDLLRRLGALDAAGRITPHGRRIGQLAVHPRLAHMLLAADRLGCLPLGTKLAALLSERDLLRGDPSARDIDIRTRLALLDRKPTATEQARDRDARVGHDAARRATRVARELERQLGRSSATAAPRSTADGAGTGASSTSGDDEAFVGVLLAFAYPDRIGRRRPGADRRYTLANGRGAELTDAHSLARAEYLVAIDVDDRDRDARILLAAPIAGSDIERHFDNDLERADEVAWSSREQAVIARRIVRLGALVLDENPLLDVPTELARTAMLAGMRELGIGALPWTPETRDLQARVEFARRIDLQASGGTSDWPAVNDASLLAVVDEWLAPWLDGVTRREHLSRLPLLEALKGRIGWERLRRLDELAPSHLEVPSGSRIRIDYRDENAPVVAVRLQELFGLQQSPKLAGGRAHVTFKLLSPAARPVQVTRDLESFWRSGYAEVRKDLRGRYPKHYWPENPHEAQATRSVRPRKS